MKIATEAELSARLKRMEEKLDAILSVLAEPEEDDDDEPSFDLDGIQNGAARDGGEPL